MTSRILTGVLALLLAGSLAVDSALAEDPTTSGAKQDLVADRWSPRVTLRASGNLESSGGAPQGWYLAPIHASLLPDDRLLFIATAREEEHPSGPYEIVPTTFLLDVDFGSQVEAGELWVDEIAVPVECPGIERHPERPERGHGQQPIPHDTTPGDPFAVYPMGEVCGGGPLLFDDHIGCSGHTFLADGRLFVSGGTRRLVEAATGERLASYGLPYSVIFDAEGSTWQRVGPHMLGGGLNGKPLRWYPTVTRLADGRALVTAGFERVDTLVENLSVEVWDPEAVDEPWSVLSDHASSPPELLNPNYPHVFVLPSPIERGGRSRDLVLFGAAARPLFFSVDPDLPASERWSVGSEERPGVAPSGDANTSASSLLLPIRVDDGDLGYANGSVLMAGGMGDPVHRRVDVFDPLADSWAPPLEMGVGRDFPATVLLPDQTILVLAGTNLADGDGDAEQVAQYIDPHRGLGIRWGSQRMGESRGYHTVAVLLPDGHVLVASGQGLYGSPEQPSLRLLAPPYMERDRPVITEAPAHIEYGATFDVSWQGGDGLRDISLMALGSMTHAVDMNQRHVELRLDSADPERGLATLLAPQGPAVAPPGDYLLIVLDEARSPSTGRLVSLARP